MAQGEKGRLSLFPLTVPLRGVAVPLLDLARHPERLARAVGPRWVAGELLALRLGSSSMGPVGSTTEILSRPSPIASSAPQMAASSVAAM